MLHGVDAEVAAANDEGRGERESARAISWGAGGITTCVKAVARMAAGRPLESRVGWIGVDATHMCSRNRTIPGSGAGLKSVTAAAVFV